jgi:protein-S-isoprenylcysteine O-methyltransferase Ste14
MPALVVVLRAVALLAFAAPMLLVAGRRGGAPRAGKNPGDRAPVLANFTAFGLFFPSLLAFAGPPESRAALLLALTGCLLAVAGAAVVFWSRVELGPAWSLLPVADEAGLVTTGPYRLVRHPIYLGLSMLAMGEALAFASWPASWSCLPGSFQPSCGAPPRRRSC